MIKIIDEFFNTLEFAQQAILMNVSGSSITKPINIIFNSAGYASTINNVLFTTDQPQAMCISSDVEDTKVGSLIRIDGTWYNVIDTSDDGTGISTLTLSRDKIHGR